MAKKAVAKSAEKAVKKSSLKPVIKASPKKLAKKAAPKKVAKKFVGHSTSLIVGKKAPSFEALNQNGQKITSKSLLGKKVVLYFYPKDSTPGCTLQACSLRDEYKFLNKKGYVVIGVSADDVKSHDKFATKFKLPFSILADTDMKIIKAYDVYGKKQFMGKIYNGIIRTTFIINEKGVLSDILTDIKTKEHAKQILDL